jgi:hypothetical protein
VLDLVILFHSQPGLPSFNSALDASSQRSTVFLGVDPYQLNLRICNLLSLQTLQCERKLDDRRVYGVFESTITSPGMLARHSNCHPFLFPGNCQVTVLTQSAQPILKGHVFSRVLSFTLINTALMILFKRGNRRLDRDKYPF